jgi:alkanesulfonate monooxygenase SsuD/methylene tetrahydromethanopterin reductase-like flavin-dependent oxidoreductase (luciferase family)
MDVGMMMVFASYGWENCSDARVWDEEIRLARRAADLGFDCLWSAEHHFNDYSSAVCGCSPRKCCRF